MNENPLGKTLAIVERAKNAAVEMLDHIMSNSPAGLHPREEPYLRVHCVDVCVKDQDRSLRFFLDQLGFTLAFDARLPSGERWVAVAPPNGETVVVLNAPREGSEDQKLIGRSRRTVFVTEDVNLVFERWRKRGVFFRDPPTTTSWGGIFATFEDVDGNTFSLVEFDEIHRAIESERRTREARLQAERRIAQEMDIAKEVQARLLPQRLPILSTLDYAGVCIQARQVGGDYYDFLDLGQGRVGFVMADVAGKGIAGALLMANLQANLRSQYALALDNPERLLKSVNRLFYENSAQSSYATLFFAEYFDSSRRLRYANCGHLAPIVLKGDDSVELLDPTSTVLGLFERWECPVTEYQLAPGDTLVLYTDGLTEALNAAEEEFGEERLIAALRANRRLPAAAILQAVVSEIQAFSGIQQYDDITLVIAKVKPQESGCGAERFEAS
jgi:serine phosphatase RsbU (regulator of sigma subunit)/predicted enzyme related to lactoylglutathione lyase